MPKAYYRCPVCRCTFSTRYKPDEEPPEIFCKGQINTFIHEEVTMVYKGDILKKRRNRFTKEPS